MSADLSGLNPIDRAAGPVAAIAGAPGAPGVPSRAVARRVRTEHEPEAALPSGSERPLQGSGLDLLDVLSTADRVSRRSATGSVALEVGLEQARAALLRSRPSDALAALDDIWPGAEQTEEGWYLRSGALSVLGLPAESDKVAGDGLALRPLSNALRFLQSVARMAIGDVAGARASLQPEMSGAPLDPILIMQHALLQASAGDPRSAEAVLARLRTLEPGHPALAWGKGALRALIADDTRQRSRDWQASASNALRVDVIDEIFHGAESVPLGPCAERIGEAVHDGAIQPTADELPAAPPTSDLAASAFERIGARIAAGSPESAAQEARLLLRALSAGGSLASVLTGEQAHAARVVLMAIVGWATGEGSDAPATLRRIMSQIVPMLQQGRIDEARMLVHRQRSLARGPVSRFLLAITRGAAPTTSSASASTPASLVSDHVMGALEYRSVNDPIAPLVRGDAERNPLAAIRVGLGLLEETVSTRAADPTLRFGDDVGARSGDRVVLSPHAAAAAVQTRNAEADGAGWGSAWTRAAASTAHDLTSGTSIRFLAVCAVVLAVLALATGHGGVATVLAVAAMWIGVRRNRQGGPTAHTREEQGARLRAVGESAETPPSP